MPGKIYHLKNFTKAPQGPKIDYAKELNQEQLKVVRKADGPCLVLAGAGSGKTRTLVYRVAYLLEKGVKPENILLMTFTNKAAKEMISRVERLLTYQPRGMWSGTFHHVGNRILRHYITRLGYRSQYSILDEEDSRSLLKKIISEKNLSQEKYFPKNRVIKNIISFSLNSGKTLTEVYETSFSYLSQELLEPIKEIAHAYQKKKKQLNALDYDDLLLQWLKLMKKFPDTKKILAHKFHYILVDEYQDTNHLQAKIVEELTSHHGNVLVVGDDAQSIYSFRAANIENILNFPKKFPRTTIFKLQTNYRSTPEILDLANDSIRHNRKQFSKKLKPVKAPHIKPIVIPVQNNDQQAECITQRVLELNEEGVPLKNMAVLFRADYHAMELELALNKKSIPYIKRGGVRFFEQAHLKDVLAFLKIVHNPQDELAWYRILILQAGIGQKGAQKILNSISKKNLAQIISMPVSFSDQLGKAWRELLPVLRPLSSIPKNAIADLIQSVLDRFYTAYIEAVYDNAPKRLEDMEQLINLADHYASLEQLLHEVTLSENFHAERVTGNEGRPDDFLILSTIHQAKGLEWKAVFVINLISGQFPHAKAINSRTELEEERRLFYVACTRAQDHLYLTYPIVSYNHSSGFIFTQPSEFLQELDEKLFDLWHVEQSQEKDDLPTIEYL